MILGLHTKKEMETERALAKEDALRCAKVEFQNEKNKLEQKHEIEINNLKIQLAESNADLIEEQTKNDFLRFYIACETDKEVDRLEHIKKRTKKQRKKKKIENRIIDYKMRKLSLERR